jgi:hypothetical protein
MADSESSQLRSWPIQRVSCSHCNGTIHWAFKGLTLCLKGQFGRNQTEVHFTDPEGSLRGIKKGFLKAILMTSRIGHSKETIFYYKYLREAAEATLTKISGMVQ